MGIKRHTPEQIIFKLREADVALAQASLSPPAIRSQTCFRTDILMGILWQVRVCILGYPCAGLSA